ncbi:MAG: chromate transporter [Synergistaceae bacterium]|nr:chromate transporter [Synergistaceae bacterium]MBR0093700.1 chromate transporter [Synergistaceae bacterium]
MLEKLRSCLRLYYQFLKFGSFTFGGGWSIVAQMKELYVEREKSLTNEELLDLTSIGRSLPGTMIGNIAMFYGHRVAGFWGGCACVFGMISVPMLVLMAITTFYTAFQNNLWVASAMRGVRTAVVPVIVSALTGMIKSAFKIPPCYVVAAAMFALYFFGRVSCVWLVIIGAVLGLVMCEYYERVKNFDVAA